MKQTGMVLCVAVLCLLRPADAAPLLANGGFETGDLAGWTFTRSNSTFEGSPHDGSNSARFGGPGSLSQTLSLQSGATYELSFFVANFGGSDNALSISFGGDVVDAVANAGTFGYTHVRLPGLTALSSQTALAFSFAGANSQWGVDQIKLTRTDQLLTNGGFENGYTGWERLTANPAPHSSTQVAEGNYSARLTTKDLNFTDERGILRQAVETEAGRKYDVSFWLQDTSWSRKAFTAAFGGTGFWNYSGMDTQHPGARYAAQITAESELTELLFTENNQGSWYLDDVRVSLVPDAIALADAIRNAPGLVAAPAAAESPEPGTMMLLGSGLICLAAGLHRRNRKRV